MKAEDILEHHGIKGQKWGIRHDPKTGRVSSDHRRVAELRKRPASSLTNKQLQTLNTRLNLEQNFNRLNPGKVQKGQNHIKAVVATAGLITAVVNIVNGPIGQAAAKFIKKSGKTVVK